jgi:hypothetical protein
MRPPVGAGGLNPSSARRVAAPPPRSSSSSPVTCWSRRALATIEHAVNDDVTAARIAA